MRPTTRRTVREEMQPADSKEWRPPRAATARCRSRAQAASRSRCWSLDVVARLVRQQDSCRWRRLGGRRRTARAVTCSTRSRARTSAAKGTGGSSTSTLLQPVVRLRPRLGLSLAPAGNQLRPRSPSASSPRRQLKRSLHNRLETPRRTGGPPGLRVGAGAPSSTSGRLQPARSLHACHPCVDTLAVLGTTRRGLGLEPARRQPLLHDVRREGGDVGSALAGVVVLRLEGALPDGQRPRSTRCQRSG